MERRYMESDASNALSSSELAAIARRYDFEPLYEQLTDPENNPKPKSAVAFFSNRTHQTDFHADDRQTFCYLCSINAHEHERIQPRDQSQRRKLILYKNPKARLSSSARISENPSSSNFISYRFIVRTSAQKESGTRAQVFLYLYGTENNWTSIYLQERHPPNSSASIDGFPSGSIRTFCLKGPDIGQLHHLNVNLVGARSEKEWFLKEIEITNLNTSTTWLCEFNCWLPKIDEQAVSSLKATVHRETEFVLSIYILQIRTGRKPFAGSDVDIQIIIRGSKNSTCRLTLTSNRAKLFEQNQLDTFAISGDDLGDLLELTVESDRNQLVNDWDIKEMILWKIIPSNAQEKSPVYFPFNTWLGKKVGTVKSRREVYPVTDHHFNGPICYQVSVKTGTVSNAGTNANVFLIIYGQCGRTIIHQLDHRRKNDFERNSISEFTIMDIDIGKIDRIKIWHDNSSPGSAWFLDSVIIRKKYCTCHTISNIYVQRLEQISNVLYRKVRELMKKNSIVRESTVNEDERRYIDRQDLRSNQYNNNESKDRLGNSRGILRSPIMYDKANLQKKVTWDEQSIGSQDDLLSINSERSMTKTEQNSRKQGSLPQEVVQIDHQVYWISSHNYIDNQWQIESIEEISSFHLDQSTRSLLLSDRSARHHHQNKSPTGADEDEIYSCQANRWLAKDKEDGNLEVDLPAKLIHQSSIDSKKKYLIPPDIPNESQGKTNDDEREVGKETKRSPLHELRSFSSRFPNTAKTPMDDRHLLQRNISSSSGSNITLTQHSKSPRHIHDLTDSMNSKRELLTKLTDGPVDPLRTPIAPTISSSRRFKSSLNIDEQDLSESLYHPPLPVSLSSPRGIHELATPTIRERQSLARSSDTPPNYPRLSSDHKLKSSRSNKDLSVSSLNSRDSSVKNSRESSNDFRSIDTSISLRVQPLKSPRNTGDLIKPLPSESELLARITNDPPYQSIPTTSLSRHGKVMRNTNDLLYPSMNNREILEKIPPTPSFPSNQPSKSARLSNASLSLHTGPQLAARSHVKLSPQKSIYDQVYNSAYSTAPSDDF